MPVAPFRATSRYRWRGEDRCVSAVVRDRRWWWQAAGSRRWIGREERGKRMVAGEVAGG